MTVEIKSLNEDNWFNNTPSKLEATALNMSSVKFGLKDRLGDKAVKLGVEQFPLKTEIVPPKFARKITHSPYVVPVIEAALLGCDMSLLPLEVREAIVNLTDLADNQKQDAETEFRALQLDNYLGSI